MRTEKYSPTFTNAFDPFIYYYKLSTLGPSELDLALSAAEDTNKPVETEMEQRYTGGRVGNFGRVSNCRVPPFNKIDKTPFSVLGSPDVLR